VLFASLQLACPRSPKGKDKGGDMFDPTPEVRHQFAVERMADLRRSAEASATTGRRRSLVGGLTVLTVAAAVLVALATAAVPAMGAKRPSQPVQANTIVGSWDVVVTIEGQPPFRALATFEEGGTTVESPAASPTLRSAGHGVWARTGSNVFAMTRLFFRFNPATGAYLGTTKVNATVTVSTDRKSFTAVSRSEMRDPTGALVVGGLRSTALGTRMQVERIDNES
jgi:hypothetical protein